MLAYRLLILIKKIKTNNLTKMLRDDSVNRLKNQEPLRGIMGKDSLVITRNQLEDDFGEES
jgi:hypothetical protein